MIYQHQYFLLDTNSGKVFDENGKELRLTGNAYRVLVFLCEKKSAKLIDIGEALDWAKDYNEDNIRQYRYKINTIIGHDVMDYKNSIYSLIGDVKIIDKIVEKRAETQRNTDLLRPNMIKWDGMKNKSQFSKWPAIVATLVLIPTLFDLPYSYYGFLRFVIMIASVYYAYWLYNLERKQSIWFWALIIVAIMFNPFFPVGLGNKSVWQVVDLVVVIFFVFLVRKLNKTNKFCRNNNFKI